MRWHSWRNGSRGVVRRLKKWSRGIRRCLKRGCGSFEQLRDFNEGIFGGGSEGERWRNIGGRLVLEEDQEIVSRLTEVILLSDSRERDNRWEPFNGDTITGGLCAGNEDLMRTVVLEGGANVETIKSMNSKGTSLPGRLVNDDSGARDSERGAVKVEVTKDACMGRELRLSTRRTKKIQGQIALGK
jgi:hypothetical protein